MLPVIAIVGRPNVGKSTLFNRLTRTRDALIVDEPGVTRDRQYGEGCIDEQRFIVIDTGGIGEATLDIEHLTEAQSRLAMQEADILLFMVDAKSGVTSADVDVANELRRLNKKVHLVVNKVDGKVIDEVVADFYQLGFTDVHAIAASHGRGVNALLETVLSELPKPEEAPEEDVKHNSIKVAIVGRPNVGKSTLINRLLGEERTIVYDMPGTTRSSIYIPHEHQGVDYTFIDTAGVRRRSHVTETVETFSVIKALQAIEAADVSILVLNAREEISGQDQRLFNYIIDAGRAVVIAVNKWDGLDTETKKNVRGALLDSFHFVDYVKIQCISALHGTGVGSLYTYIKQAYRSSRMELTTGRLTTILQDATTRHEPPMVHGRRIKLRLAHAGGHQPPIIVIHGKQTEALPETYKRYLMHVYHKALKIVGTPIRLQFKTDSNPYEGKKNVLTPGQHQKRQRMMRHYRK